MSHQLPPRDERPFVVDHAWPGPPEVAGEPWDRSTKGRRRVGWRRRVAVRTVPTTFWAAGWATRRQLDGGQDAPLDARGLRIWHVIVGVVVVAGVAMVAAAVLVSR
jgi:hypothetical protein